MCQIDLEPCEVWQETHRRARKSHVCHCCGGSIDSGEVYIVHFSVSDGEVTTEKMCALCDLAAADFQQHHKTRSNPSYMRELLEECLVDEVGYRSVYIDDEETRQLMSATAAKWKRYLDEMNERREARRVHP
jgi:hypothetical protein